VNSESVTVCVSKNLFKSMVLLASGDYVSSEEKVEIFLALSESVDYKREHTYNDFGLLTLSQPDYDYLIKGLVDDFDEPGKIVSSLVRNIKWGLLSRDENLVEEDEEDQEDEEDEEDDVLVIGMYGTLVPLNSLPHGMVSIDSDALSITCPACSEIRSILGKFYITSYGWVFYGECGVCGERLSKEMRSQN